MIESAEYLQLQEDEKAILQKIQRGVSNDEEEQLFLELDYIMIAKAKIQCGC